VAYHRSTAGLLGKKPLVLQVNVAKGSRQNSCVTLEDSVAPKAEVVMGTRTLGSREKE